MVVMSLMSVVSFETIYSDRIALLKQRGEAILIQSVFTWMEDGDIDGHEMREWGLWVKTDLTEWTHQSGREDALAWDWLMEKAALFKDRSLEWVILNERALPRRTRLGVLRGQETQSREDRLSSEMIDEMRNAIRWERWELEDEDGLVGLLNVDQNQFALIRELGSTRHDVWDFLRSQWRLIPWVICLTLFVGWWIATRALRPVNKVVKAMNAIGLVHLSERMDLNDTTVEFEELVEVYHSMLDRLEASFHQATRFSADAAHELKTPLTILQGELEAGIGDAEMGSEAQQRLSLMLDEVVRLRILTERLLLLARADASGLNTEGEPFDFGLAVTEWVEVFADTLEGIDLQIEVSPLLVKGSEPLLRQAVMNLLSNAGKYNSEGGRIAVWLREERGEAVLDVYNTGSAISVEAQKAIFRRFYRGDQSRNRRVDGLGLGLSLVHAIISAHGGTVVLVASDVQGTRFRLKVPVFNP